MSQQSERRSRRLAIVASHPVQYHVPLYRRLAQVPELETSVLYCSRQGVGGYFDAGFGQRIAWDTPLLEGYHHEFLPNLRRHDVVAGFASLVNPSVVGRIRRGRFDAVWVHGYGFVTLLLAIAAARRFGAAVLYRSESSRYYDLHVRRSLAVRLLKPLWLRSVFGRVDRFLAIGSRNRELYLHYGVPPERIFHVPYVVDNDYFAARAAALRPGRAAMRAELGIGPADIVFMFLGKLYAGKRPLELIRAYHRLSDVSAKALILVGEGEMRPQLESYVRDSRVPGVHFVGFANQSEVPRYCAMSDALVRPDGLAIGDWGLTVNEAMASGLAVIATDAIGATDDLVRDGDNGYAIRFGKDNVVMEDLVGAMRRMATDPDACRRMGQRSLEIIRDWGLEQCKEGVLAALRSLEQ